MRHPSCTRARSSSACTAWYVIVGDNAVVESARGLAEPWNLGSASDGMRFSQTQNSLHTLRMVWAKKSSHVNEPTGRSTAAHTGIRNFTQAYRRETRVDTCAGHPQ